MKKIYLTLGIAALFLGANAQQLRIGHAQLAPETLTQKGANPSVNTVTVDTLFPASIMAGGCAVTTGTASGFYNYINDRVAPYDSGYIFGTGILPLGNGQSTKATELGQKYAVTGSVTVTDVLVLAGKAYGGTVTTTAKIYNEDATTHKPSTVKGSASTPVPMSSYVTGGQYTAFHFVSPITVAAGKFFATISVPAFGGSDQDTLSILSTRLGSCSSVDSNSAIKFGAPVNGWYLVKTGFGQNGDLMIFPVININTVGINTITKGSLSLFAAFPNPASNSININFSLENASKIDIEVFDMSGRLIKAVKPSETFASGKHAVSIDLAGFEAGSYMYSINAGGAKMFSKFVVTK